MILNTYSKYFQLLKSISRLLGSGFITSIGFVILSSNRIDYINVEGIIDMLVFLQLHAIGLTILKLGYDSLSYAAFLENPHLKPDIAGFIIKMALPLSFIVFLISNFKFGIFISVILVVNVLLDLYSSLVVSQLGFRHDFNKVVFLNLLSYPLFFCEVILISYFFELEFYQFSILFLLNILLKFVFSKHFFSKMKNSGLVSITPTWSIGLQQLLNYGLFKADLVIVSLPLVFISIFNLSDRDILEVLFLSRFPELVSGVTLGLSVLYYPKINHDNILAIFRNYKWYVFFYFILLLISMCAFVQFWNHDFELRSSSIFSYFLAGFLVVFCNLITFNLIRKNKIRFLLFSLISSLFLATFLLILASFFSLNIFLSLVMLQMLVFVLVTNRFSFYE